MALEEYQSTAPVDTDEQDVTGSAATSTAVAEEETTPSQESVEEQPEQEESMADAIAKAVNGEESDSEESEEGEPSDEDPEKETEASDAEADDEEDDGSDVEEGQKIPYKRFKKVIDQRNEWKTKVETAEQERDQYRQGHEQFDALQGFMKSHGLQNEDVAEALQLAALYVNDPAKAAEMLQPKLRTLQQFTGEVLPDDLQDRVKNGELSAQDARELVSSRNQAALLQQRQQQQEAEQQQQRTQQQTMAARNAMATTADQVAASLAAGDPDFGKKEHLVRRELQALIAERNPQTAQDAAALVREAYDSATKYLRQFAPKPQMRPGPSSTQGRPSAQAAREPETMAEAIAQAVNNPE